MYPQLPTIKTCTGCGLCADSCPHHAINISYNKNGFLQPTVNQSLCIGCKICEKRCPVLQTPQNHLTFGPIYYKAHTTNKNWEAESSSGGIFPAIANFILQSGKGVVFGAELTNEGTVTHSYITDIKDIKRLQGSKYIQSNTSGIYKKVINFLQEDYTVLFSGTPCQIAAVKKATQYHKLKGKLITIDLVCHGIPTIDILHTAKKYYKANNIQSFRNKKNGWGKHNFHITYITKNSQLFTPINDIFYQLYFQDLCLRKSCYNCLFTHLPRISDITIADYWEKNQNETGISLAIANTPEGQSVLQHCNNISIKPVTLSECLPYNPNICFSKYELEKVSLSDYIYLLKKLPLKVFIAILSCQSSNFILKIFIKPFALLVKHLHSKANNRIKRSSNALLKY